MFLYHATREVVITNNTRMYKITGWWGLLEDISVTKPTITAARTAFKKVQARKPDYWR